MGVRYCIPRNVVTVKCNVCIPRNVVTIAKCSRYLLAQSSRHLFDHCFTWCRVRGIDRFAAQRNSQIGASFPAFLDYIYYDYYYRLVAFLKELTLN